MRPPRRPPMLASIAEEEADDDVTLLDATTHSESPRPIEGRLSDVGISIGKSDARVPCVATTCTCYTPNSNMSSTAPAVYYDYQQHEQLLSRGLACYPVDRGPYTSLLVSDWISAHAMHSTKGYQDWKRTPYLCEACLLSSQKFQATKVLPSMCPLCDTLVSSRYHGSPMMLRKRRFGVKDAVTDVCSAARRFYGVWTTVLGVWVIALVLISDLQSYSKPPDYNITMPTILPSFDADPSDYNRLRDYIFKNTDVPSVDPSSSSSIQIMVNSATWLPGDRDGKGSVDDFVSSIVRTDGKVVSFKTNTQLNAAARKEVQTDRLVRVQVFYEPLCPDSRHFVRYQLRPAMDKLGEHIDMQLVPYGKATTTEERGRISFRCQHGPTECLANKVHGCVVREVKEQKKQVELVDCMIADNYKPKLIAQKCVSKILGADGWGPIRQCFTGRAGDMILKHMGSITHSLEPAISFIPTITVDGSQDDQKSILVDLSEVICKRLKGELPSACTSEKPSS